MRRATVSAEYRVAVRERIGAFPSGQSRRGHGFSEELGGFCARKLLSPCNLGCRWELGEQDVAEYIGLHALTRMVRDTDIMSDREKIRVLQDRLEILERRGSAPWEKSIREVARLALETEIAQLGKRVVARTPARRNR